MASWLNSDGLLIGFGVSEALAATGGEYEDHVTGNKIQDYLINLTSLSTATPVYANILNQTNMAVAGFASRDLFPCNHILEKVEVYTEIGATTGTSAALNVGFWDQTANATISATGAVNALAVTSMATAGQLITLTNGVTSVGAKQGLVVYNAGIPAVNHQILVSVQTSVGTFTAGIVRVRLWSRRSLAQDTSSSVDD